MDVEGPNDEARCGDAMEVSEEGGGRLTAQWQSMGERFVFYEREIDSQYAQMYFCRLNQLAPRTRDTASRKWPDVEVVNILGVKEGVTVVVVGMVLKKMKLRPSVLENYAAERGVRRSVGKNCLCSEDDTLLLEDESAQIALSGPAALVDKLVTGLVIAVRGSQHKSGRFEVTGICFPAGTPQPPLPQVEDKYIAFMSGMGRCISSKHPPLPVDLAIEFLSGSLVPGKEKDLAQKIVRVILAGGGFGTAKKLDESTGRSQLHAMAPVKDIQMSLVELASTVEVDLLPGRGDPAGYALPLQPMNRLLFGASREYRNLRMVTNPYEFEVDGVRLLGTSKICLDDIARYSTASDHLEILKSFLDWKHLAPTAPDTLSCFPLTVHDPFVLDEIPHVLFVGDQQKFKTKVVQVDGSMSVRLISIPDFGSTREIVLLNIRTLKCHTVSFDTSSISM